MKNARNMLRMIMMSTIVAVLCSLAALAETTNYDLYTFRVWVTADGHSTGTDIGKADSWYVLDTYGTTNGTKLRLKAAGDNQYYIQAWYPLRGGSWITLYIFDGSSIGSGSGFVQGFDTSGGKYYISGYGPDNESVAKWTLKNGSFYTKVGSTEYVLYIDYNEEWGDRPFRLSTNKNHPQRVSYTRMTLSPHVHTEGSAVQQNKVAATCTTDGSYVQVVNCSGCGAEMSRSTITVPASGHTWIAADCDTPKTCSVCEETEGIGLGHSYTTKVSAVLAGEATCTAAATYYLQCDRCEAVSESETLAVGKENGHEWLDATCTAPKTCPVCEETEGTVLGHDWSEWSTTVEPTYITEGTESRTCGRCRETEERPVASTGQAVVDGIQKEQEGSSVTLEGVPADLMVFGAAYLDGQMVFVQILEPESGCGTICVPEETAWDLMKVFFTTEQRIPVACTKEYGPQESL